MLTLLNKANRDHGGDREHMGGKCETYMNDRLNKFDNYTVFVVFSFSFLFFPAFLKLYVLLCFMCNTPSLTIQLMNPKMGLVSAFEICLFSH